MMGCWQLRKAGRENLAMIIAGRGRFLDGGNPWMEPLIAGPLGKSLNIDIYRGLSHDWGVRRETWRGGTDVICVRFLQMSDMGRRCHAGRRKGNVGTDWNRNLGRMVKGGKKGVDTLRWV